MAVYLSETRAHRGAEIQWRYGFTIERPKHPPLVVGHFQSDTRRDKVMQRLRIFKIPASQVILLAGHLTWLEAYPNDRGAMAGAVEVVQAYINDIRSAALGMGFSRWRDLRAEDIVWQLVPLVALMYREHVPFEELVESAAGLSGG